ncbi:Serine/threonine-protein kinase SIK2 [Perkinsela sp. CCAP 1560/4]|nr:Serine/threonine-protein kinase [Perkinsela sp. CCAP 1560/4]KNH08924.1 Serine/threonine-protein kinase SIK2 [Perkinsela sp. CCAP 1560/4]|eukprot:KNH04290.1 Serine/threonine-protein kinase [Perkinsela sp. CCAP 1560/4]
MTAQSPPHELRKLSAFALDAFDPLFTALPATREATRASADCHWWHKEQEKCVAHDIHLLAAYDNAVKQSVQFCALETHNYLLCKRTQSPEMCIDRQASWEACLAKHTNAEFEQP